MPIIEEIFFRGGIYRIMKKHYSFILSAFITSTLFAIGHENRGGAFLGSLILIGVYKKSGYLGSCIVAHILSNALFYFAVYYHYLFLQ